MGTEARLPLAPWDRTNLPQVAQYLAVRHQSYTAVLMLAEYFTSKLVERYGALLPKELQDAASVPADTQDYAAKRLGEIIGIVGRHFMEANPLEPHRILAKLRLPLYLTATTSDLMHDALKLEKLDPVVGAFPWGSADQTDWPGYDLGPDGEYPQPDPNRPLVYHLFGRLRDPATVALSEDDFFDYLLNLRRHEPHRPRARGQAEASKTVHRLPTFMTKALRHSGLLFLGFSFDDWTFRVFLRSLKTVEPPTTQFTHVAVEMHPDEAQMVEPEAARAYLQDYLQGADIQVYLGSVSDFIAKLKSVLALG